MITFITRPRGVAQNKIIYKFTLSDYISDNIKLNQNKHPQETGFNNEGVSLTSWRLVPSSASFSKKYSTGRSLCLSLCMSPVSHIAGGWSQVEVVTAKTGCPILDQIWQHCQSYGIPTRRRREVTTHRPLDPTVASRWVSRPFLMNRLRGMTLYIFSLATFLLVRDANVNLKMERMK